MTEADRELLEKAAKACGKEIDLDRYDDEMGFIILGISRWWNPLVDDGDALRLAAKLQIDVTHNHPADQGYVAAERRGCEGVFGPVCAIEDEFEEKQRIVATRRAIVRAAAAIQEAREAV